MQSHLHSFFESLANVAIGFSVALGSQLILFSFYGVHISIMDNIAITIWMTAISLARSYTIRRIFNKMVKIK